MVVVARRLLRLCTKFPFGISASVGMTLKGHLQPFLQRTREPTIMQLPPNLASELTLLRNCQNNAMPSFLSSRFGFCSTEATSLFRKLYPPSNRLGNAMRCLTLIEPQPWYISFSRLMFCRHIFSFVANSHQSQHSQRLETLQDL